MRKRASVAILTMAIGAMAAASNRVAAELIYGVTKTDTQQQLVIGWDSADPSAIWSVYSLGSVPVLGMDATPYSAGVWILQGNQNLYRRNFSNTAGVSFLPYPAPSGLTFGFEYNPVASPPPVNQFIEMAHFTVVSDLNESQSRSPAPPVANPALAYALGDVNQSKDPSIFGIAYTNNVPGATSTTLYGIDSAWDVLVTVDVLTGALHTVGPLGVDVISEGAFDISGNSGVAYATMKRANSSQSEFWTIDLVSGAAASRGAIGGGITVTAMTTAVPEPTSLMLMTAPLALFAATNRRR
jgi:hypothetical protein